MSVLRVFLFGNVRVMHDDAISTPATPKLTRGVQALLAYLVLQQCHTDTRDFLAGLFWREFSEERARSCLNTAVWRLRRVLEPPGVPPGTYLTTLPQEGIRFNCESTHWLDVKAFEEQVTRFISCPVQSISAAEATAVEEVLSLYTADLLENFYEDWAVQERERLQCLYLNGLTHVMDYSLHHRACEQSLSYGQRILRHDPLREDIHRQMMRLCMQSGQRALALRQYEACRAALRSELNIEPMLETRTLYEACLKASENVRSQIPGEAKAVRSQREAMREFRAAMRAFDDAYSQLRHAMVQLAQTVDNDGADEMCGL